MTRTIIATSTLEGVLTTLANIIIEWWKNLRQGAILRFSDNLLIYKFEKGVRVHLAVDHIGGRQPVTAAMPYLTVKYGNSEELPPRIFLRKGEILFYKIAYDSNRYDYDPTWDYLLPVPDKGFATIMNEPLPWTLPKTPEGPYFYTCFIPVKGHGKVALLDAYKYELKELDEEGKVRRVEEGYLLRVFSEYGTEEKPRAVFKLPKGEGALKEELRLEVKVTGDNVKEETKAEIIVRYNDKKGDYFIKYLSEEVRLGKLLKEIMPLRIEVGPLRFR